MNFIRAMLASLALSAGCFAETIRVGAAVSLKDAFGEIASKYEAATGERVEFVFGSSGQIMAQIKSGADIDLFVSAANKQADDLIAAKLANAEPRRVVAANALVLIVPADAKSPPASFAALADATVGKIAVGEPKTVPAGQYAKQVLDSLKLSDALSNKLVYGANVRQVLTYVTRGEVSAGVVYATDAKEAGDGVRVVATAAENTHQPIVYPAVVVTASKKRDAAVKFLDYLATADAKAVLTAKGFKLPGVQ